MKTMKALKNNLMWFLLALLVIPTVSFGAETYTLQIDFSFNTAPDPAKQLLGYRLYKEGEQVCQTAQPDSSSISCDFLSDAGTFNFTLTAYYSNNTESPHSPAFPFTLEPAATPPVSNESPTAVVTSTTTVGSAPLTVTFKGTSSTSHNPPIVRYRWVFGDGTRATGPIVSHVFTTAGTYHTRLIVTDSQGLTDKVATPIVVGSAATRNRRPVAVISADLTQNDEIPTGIDDTQAADFVIASPPITDREKEPALVRLRNITSRSFEIRLQEWDYQDGTHARETVNYVVMEKGVFTLSNGAKVEAGEFTGTKNFDAISLQQSYDPSPVILTQIITENNAFAVTGRVRTINQHSFEYKLQEQQTTQTSHTSETVGYIAWQPGTGTLPGLHYETDIAVPGITKRWTELDFQTGFADMPFFIAGMQTCNGGDTASLRGRRMSQTAIDMKIEEEQSGDAEVGHAAEEIGYLVIGAINN
jgi:PKD repeat protein